MIQLQPYLWILWGLWIAQALFSALNLMRFERSRRKQDCQFIDVGPQDERLTALIVSIKGFDENQTPRFFESILTQDYAKYRTIITMESEDEPIVAWLREQLELGEKDTVWRPENPTHGIHEVVMVFAGESTDCGQKVHNQIEAFKHLIDEDEIIAFADADIRCDKTWLSMLLAPINKGTHQLSTTYRWLVPKKHTLANLFASVINSSVATLSGREGYNMMWGGSMALSRDAFKDLDVPVLFSGSLNDDLRLAKAGRRSGYKICLRRSLIMRSPINQSWGGLIEFGRRQYYQVKHFTPTLFIIGLILTWLYVLGAVSAFGAVFFLNNFHAWIPIGIVTLFDQIRALYRARVIRNLYGGTTAKILDDTAAVEHLFTPIWMSLHCLIVTLALFARKITWAGITYRVLSPSRTIVVKRKGSKPAKKAAVAPKLGPEDKVEPEEKSEDNSDSTTGDSKKDEKPEEKSDSDSKSKNKSDNSDSTTADSKGDEKSEEKPESDSKSEDKSGDSDPKTDDSKKNGKPEEKSDSDKKEEISSKENDSADTKEATPAKKFYRKKAKKKKKFKGKRGKGSKF